MDVFIRCSSGWWSVHVNPEDTVAHLKCKIERQYPFRKAHTSLETGIPFLIYRVWNILTFCISYDFKMQQRSLNLFDLSVISPFFEIIRIVVDSHSRILDLKQEIARSEGVEVSRQILRAGEQVLRDDKTLRDYDIEGSAVLWLEFRSAKACGVFLQGAASFVLGVGVFLQALLIVWLLDVAIRVHDEVMCTLCAYVSSIVCVWAYVWRKLYM